VDGPSPRGPDQVEELGPRRMTARVHLVEPEPEVVEPVVEDAIGDVVLAERLAHGVDERTLLRGPQVDQLREVGEVESQEVLPTPVADLLGGQRGVEERPFPEEGRSLLPRIDAEVRRAPRHRNGPARKSW